MGPTDESQTELTEGQWACIEPIVDEFAQALQAGRQPEISQYLVRIDPSLQEKLREELVGEQFAHRFGDATEDGRLRYRPIAALGQGNFGEVYKAWDEVLSRPVALKVLLRTEANAKRNFFDEAQRQANCRHSHLVALYDAGKLPKGQPFAVMEYIDGDTLRRKLDVEGPLAPEVAARIAEQVALALAEVHRGTAGTRRHPSRPLVHRDLKPENILIDGNGEAHVADFGLAAAVADMHDGAAGFGGTIPYMSPEQATAFRPGMSPAPIDTRSDIWALGVVLYEMLSGEQPFFSTNTDPRAKLEDIIESILNYKPQQLHDLKPGVPPEIEGLVDECLKRDPGERIQSAADVAQRLRSWLDSVAAIPPPLEFSAVLDALRRDFVDRRWLFEVVDAWPEHRDQRLLLLVGEPGSGKSAFLAELIHQNPQQRIVAWHLCRDKWPETRSTANFVRSLAGMLATNVESYRHALASLPVREALRNETCQTDPGSAFETGIVSPIAKATPPGDGVYFVIVDALDEADLSYAVSIPDLLATWEQRLPDWLRIVATTRRGGIRPDMFSHVQSFDVDRDNATHAADIRDDISAYVRGRLQQANLAERLVQDRVLAEDAARRLLEKSEANFLYVVEALAGVERDLCTFRQLDECPPGLRSLYEGFFRRQWPNKRRYAAVRPILEVLVAAREPISEVLLAAAVDMDAYPLNEGLNEFAQYLHRRQDRVCLRHQAIAEWLVETQGSYRVIPSEGHERLQNACWQEYERKVPLSRYSLRYLPSHLMGTEQWDRLEQLLTDVVFLDRKAEAGMTFDLVRDYAVAVDKMPTNRPDRQTLQLLGKALQRDANFIFKHPTTLFQCMWNTCWWHDCAEAEHHYESVVSVAADQISSESSQRPHLTPSDLWRGLLRALVRFGRGRAKSLPSSDQNPEPAPPAIVGEARCEPPERPLSTLMESWRRLKMEVSPTFPWLRSLRPPPLDLRTGKTAILGRLDGPISSLVFTPDGQQLASGTFRGSIGVWNSDTGEQVARLNNACDEVYGLTWRKSGPTLGGAFYSQSSGSWALLGDHDDPRFLTNDNIDGVVLSPDGRLLLGEWPDGTMRIWDILTAKELHCLGTNWFKFSTALSPNGKRAAMCSTHQVAIWNVDSGTQLHRVDYWREYTAQRLGSEDGYPGSPLCVAFSPDGRSIAIGFENTVWLWNAETGIGIRRIGSYGDGARCVAFSPDRRLLATGIGRTLRVFDLNTGSVVCVLHVPEDHVRCVAFSADGRRVASGHSFGEVRIWEWDAVGTAGARRLSGHEDHIGSVAFSPNGRLVASASDKTVRLWDAASGIQVANLTGNVESRSDQTCFSPSGQLVAAGRGRSLQIWDIGTGKQVKCFQADDDIGCVAFSPDGHLVAGGCGRWRRSTLRPDCRVWVWKVDDGTLVCNLNPRGHEVDVLSVAFSPPDGQRLAVAAKDGTVTIWDIATSNEIRQLSGHEDAVYSLAFTSNGEQLISKCMDATLRIWDTNTGDCCAVIIGGDDVTAVADSLPLRLKTNWSQLETVIESSITGEAIAWWPGSLSDNFATDPSGRIWAGGINNHLCLFALEGDASRL